MKSAESQYLERKAACPKEAELRETICAFANSTPSGQYSVLFIGVEDRDGNVCGVDPTTVDGTQKKIIKVASFDCYPPIYVVPQAVMVDGKTVLAIVVEHSKETPHFTGHAYVRTGPTNVKASKKQYDELVLMRTDKVAALLREKAQGALIRVQWNLPEARVSIIEHYRTYNHPAYRIEDCDAFVLKLQNTGNMQKLAVPIDRVTISYSTGHSSMLLLINEVYPGAT